MSFPNIGLAEIIILGLACGVPLIGAIIAVAVVAIRRSRKTQGTQTIS